MRSLLLCVGVAVSSAAVTVLVLFLVSAPREPLHQQISFSEFLSLVEAGSVTDIRVHGPIYTFDVLDSQSQRSTTKETIGPRVSLEELRTLRPADATRAPPKVSVE